MEDNNEIPNFKGMRKKPMIFGMNTLGFLIFAGVSIMSLLTLINSFALTKIFVVIAIIAVTYFLCLALGSEKIRSFVYDENLPKKFSDYE
jgi:hypothetical protein